MPVCNANVSSEEYADFILRHGYRNPAQVIEIAGTNCVDIVDREYAIVYSSLSGILPLSLSHHSYMSIPKIYGLQDTTALESAGILPVFEQPAINATGRGVLMGMIDTGIEYTNPLFRLSDGSSRILGIWDQTITPPSEGREVSLEEGQFQPLYGTFYSKEEIDLALISEDPYLIVPSRDTDGHGTFMAGTAAGGRIDQPAPYSGAAPEASLLIVKLKPAKQYLRDFFLIRPDIPAFQENDIMMAVQYLLERARHFRMPLVIYLGVGTSQGNHDGTSPLGLQLQKLEGYIGLASVVGAGNEVGYHHHFLGNVTPEQEFEDVELRVGAEEAGFSLEMWSREPELYTVGFISPSGAKVDRVPLILGDEAQLSFRLDTTTITVNYRTAEAGTGSQLIFMRFQTPAPGIWHIRVYPYRSINGQFHMWLPMHGFISDQTIFLRPNPDTTITDPGNAAQPLTISTYDHVSNSIYIHSSRGYTRSGRIRPDLAAPGVNVQGPALTQPQMTRRTGASIAAAITAGAVADLFTWGIVDGNQPTLSNSAITSILTRGAVQNPALTYPNREWGYGTLNLYNSFLSLRE